MAASTTPTRRGRGTSAGLTRKLVLAGAERVIDAKGFDGVSIRAVATELGVSPTAIYNHVEDKADLIDSVADAFVTREILEDLPDDLPPLEAVRDLARRLHRAGAKNPGLLLSIVGHRPTQARNAQAVFGEELFVRLLAAGATESQARLLYRMVITLVAGGAVGVQNLHRPTEVSLEERTRRLIDSSPRPDVLRLMFTLPSFGDEAAFEDQLDVLLRDLPG